MGKVYTREELEGIRDRVLIQAKAFYESQGRMPSIRELLDITGVTQHAIYKVFGGKAGIEDALNEGSTREEELPNYLDYVKEKICNDYCGRQKECEESDFKLPCPLDFL